MLIKTIAAKTLIIVVILVALSSLLFVNIASYTDLNYTLGGDLGIYVPNLPTIYSYFFIWSNTSQTININQSLPEIVWQLLNYFFSKALGLAILDTINQWLIYSYGLVGMFLLIYTLTSKYGLKISILSSTFASILFVFHFDFFIRDGAVAFYFVWVILFGLLFYRSIEDRKPNPIYFALTVISLVIDVTFTGYEFLLQNSALLLAILIPFILLTNNKKYNYAHLKYLGLILVLTALIILPFLISTYFYANGGAIAEFQKGTTNLFFKLLSHNLPITLLSFGPFLIANNFQALILVAILLVCLFGLIRFDYKKNEISDRITVAFFIALVIVLGLALASNKPFGTAFNYLVTEFPLLTNFRDIYTTTHYMLLFLISSLFGISTARIFNELLKSKKRYLFAIFAIFMVIMSVSYLYEFDYLVIRAGNSPYTPSSFTLPNGVKLPNYLFEISEILNNYSGNFNVGLLPYQNGWVTSKYYYGPDIYETTIYNHPVIPGIGGGFYSPGASDMYSVIAIKSQNNSTPNYNVSKIFGTLGIKYVILQGDARYANLSECPDCGHEKFNFTKIKTVLANNNFQLITTIKNSSIYMNRFYLPLIYSSDIIKINTSINSLGMLNYLGNNTVNITSYSIYSKNITYNLGGYIGNLSIYKSQTDPASIKNYLRPKIEFTIDNPTKVIVHVLNATTPYYLVFRETYDPHWAAFYSNGTEVNPHDHIAVNGFANAWYMNKTGNYTITLYYTLQTDVCIAWGVSFAALFATIGIGVYGWRGQKRKILKA